MPKVITIALRATRMHVYIHATQGPTIMHPCYTSYVREDEVYIHATKDAHTQACLLDYLRCSNELRKQFFTIYDRLFNLFLIERGLPTRPHCVHQCLLR